VDAINSRKNRESLNSSRARCGPCRTPVQSNCESIFDAFGNAEAVGHIFVWNDTNYALASEHLALGLLTISVKERPMNPNRIARDRIGHQRDDHSMNAVIAKRMI